MRKKFFIAVFIVVVIGIAIFILDQRLSHVFGSGFNPNNSKDLQKLAEIAKTSEPLRNALEQFRQDHGIYPATVTNLFPFFLEISNMFDGRSDWSGWVYLEPRTNSYSLWFKVNWDDGLSYTCSSGSTNQWLFMQSGKETDLTEKFRRN